MLNAILAPRGRPSVARRGPTRLRLLVLSAVVASFRSVSSRAQPRRLDLCSYFHGETPSAKGARFFADEVTKNSGGTTEVSLAVIPPWMPLPIMSKASALAHYCAPEYMDAEPVLGLSALPMLAATFAEAEALLRIARPHYASALARHDQILLAALPSRPAALWSTFRIRSVADLRGASFPSSSSVGEKAGWGRTFIRLGARRGTYSEAEFMLSSGDETNVKFVQEFAYLAEIFLASQLNFLTVSRQALDSLTATQASLLVATGRAIEDFQWRLNGEIMHRDHHEVAARGVPVAAQPPSDLLATLRSAAEPDIQVWAKFAGEDGATILSDYRRAIGRQ